MPSSVKWKYGVSMTYIVATFKHIYLINKVFDIHSLFLDRIIMVLCANCVLLAFLLQYSYINTAINLKKLKFSLKSVIKKKWHKLK